VETAFASLVVAHPREGAYRLALAEALEQLGQLERATRVLQRAPASAARRRLLEQIRSHARVVRWAGAGFVTSHVLPDGRWLVATAKIGPDVLAERSLDHAKLSLFDPRLDKPVQTIPLSGPDPWFADSGDYFAAPDKDFDRVHDPVLNGVELLVRPSAGADLVFVSQQVVGASWNPTELRVLQYAGGRLTWMLSAGSRGRPLVLDENGDGSPEVVTFHSVGWRLATAHPPLWEETLTPKGARWQEANTGFPARYRRLQATFARADASRPGDPDTLFYLARCDAALGQTEAATAHAQAAVTATEQWRYPQPDSTERADMIKTIRRYFPAVSQARSAQ
jgi:hypothetical protein